MGRFLGVVVDAAYAQTEGVGPVFDNLQRAGTQAIGLWPYLLEQATAETGSRMPDLHIDGHKRLLDRPLWGQRELYVRHYLAFEPEARLYAEGPYQPPTAAPPGLARTVPQAMLAEARRRGMQAYLGLGPFTPPGLRETDRPVRVDGRTTQPPYVAQAACVNSPDAQRYALAAVADLLGHYPETDGLILDWVEFGAYRLEDVFTCFCPHCERQARAAGYDWPAMRRAATALWDWLHNLTPRELSRSRRVLANPSELVELLAAYPGWAALLAFKAESVAAVYRRIRALLDDLALPHVALVARGWCPPWNRASGSDYRRLAEVCGAVSPKLFTFDHAVLPRWYAETLLAWNPGLAEADALDAVVEWLNLPDDRQPRSLAQYGIPAPAERYAVSLECYRPRLAELVAQVGGRAACYPIAHPYLPAAQWEEMLTVIRESEVDGIWVNMYAYLSDAKLEILGRVWQ